MTHYTVHLTCPRCAEARSVPVAIAHDPGYWRNANGDGLPPSTDIELGACTACGAADFDGLEADMMKMEALCQDEPTREDFAPEHDD